MSELKFSCPHCQQHIQCDPGYAGMEIACPACNNQMLVPGQVAQPAPAVAAGVACPGCGTILAPDAMLCTQCGYHLGTGQRLQPPMVSTPRPGPGAYAAAAAAARKKPPAEGWAKNPNVVAGIALAVFVVLWILGRTDPKLAMVYLGVQAIYSLVVWIMVLVAAFGESTGTGFMTLCIPCYILYFVYGQSESPLLKGLFSVSILAQVAGIAFRDLVPTQ